jgi:hypothetical protein
MSSSEGSRYAAPCRNAGTFCCAARGSHHRLCLGIFLSSTPNADCGNSHNPQPPVLIDSKVESCTARVEMFIYLLRDTADRNGSLNRLLGAQRGWQPVWRGG